ncbi:MAG: hypothetical protein HFG74_08780 [Hungatella sp.]|nr:hypothetical protein [Hungatella sp.]
MRRLELDIEAEEMRTMLRIRHEGLDGELEGLREAFLKDISMCGVNTIPEGDALTRACLRLYLRWQENYNGEADRYKRAYMETKTAMSLAAEYREGTNEE